MIPEKSAPVITLDWIKPGSLLTQYCGERVIARKMVVSVVSATNELVVLTLLEIKEKEHILSYSGFGTHFHENQEDALHFRTPLDRSMYQQYKPNESRQIESQKRQKIATIHNAIDRIAYSTELFTYDDHPSARTFFGCWLI